MICSFIRAIKRPGSSLARSIPYSPKAVLFAYGHSEVSLI